MRNEVVIEKFIISIVELLDDIMMLFRLVCC